MSFKGVTDLENSEIEPNKYGSKKYFSDFQDLKFIVHENVSEKFTLCIEGSIHKFYNNGVHNFNDFTYSNTVEVIDRLGSLFTLNMDSCRINLIEIGVNIMPPAKTETVLKGPLSHRNKRFKSISYDNAEYFQVMHDNFIIKVYDKAKQYRVKGYTIPNEILRVELKYRKMEALIDLLNSKGIIDRDYIVLSDLRNLDALSAFGELLVRKWNEILFYDYTISKTNLSKYQQRKLDVWQNINQWGSFSKQKKSKQKSLLQEITLNHSKQLQLQVSNLIQEKLEALLQIGLSIYRFENNKKDDLLITFGIQKGLPSDHFEYTKKDDLLTTYNMEEEKRKGLPFDSIVYGSNGHLFKKLFPDEKEGSIIPNYKEFHNDIREIPF